ncbi:zinc finger BED domain-containing protein RICESLEEPER 2-like protein [Tanacetum coccineum]
MSDNTKKAQCIHCLHFFSKDSNSTLKNHINHPHCEALKRVAESGQSSMSRDGSIFVYNPDVLREQFAGLVIQRGLPFNHFDDEQTTRVFQKHLQPRYAHLENKIMSITLDNASNNTSAIGKLRLKYEPPMEGRVSMEYLPHDVLEMVLMGLDVNDLIQCKYVCKSWNSIISSLHFAKAHLNHSYSNDRNDRKLRHRRIVMCDSRYFQLVGSSNGLRYEFTFGSRLGIVDECLCIYECRWPVSKKWVMKNYSRKKTWKLLSNVGMMDSDKIHYLKDYIPHKNSICHGWDHIGDPVYVQSLVSPRVVSVNLFRIGYGGKSFPPIPLPSMRIHGFV